MRGAVLVEMPRVRRVAQASNRAGRPRTTPHSWREASLQPSERAAGEYPIACFGSRTRTGDERIEKGRARRPASDARRIEGG